jgi:hypothetical protein
VVAVTHPDLPRSISMPRHSRAAAFVAAALLTLGALSGCGAADAESPAKSGSSTGTDTVDIDAAYAGILGTPPT